MNTALVVGGCGGLGSIITRRLRDEGIITWTWDCNWNGEPDWRVDVTDQDDIDDATVELGDHLKGRQLDLLIHAQGINELSRFEELRYGDFWETMRVNAGSIWAITQCLLPFLAISNPRSTVCSIISNAAHIPMTHSLAYNASKAAALGIVRQMSRELSKSLGLTVFSISPNKLAGTPMSLDIEKQVMKLRGWTAEEARQYQLAALPAGEETDPEVLGEFVAWLLSQKDRHKYLAGCDIPYGL